MGQAAMNRQSSQSKEMQEAPSPILCRCIPFGALNRRMSDAHGESIYPAESIHDTLGTLGWAADERLIEAFSAWDDDVMPWSADNRGRIVDQQDQLIIQEIRDFIEEHGIRLTAFGCDLTHEAVFFNGALTNPSESIRALALRKLERAAYIANALDAESFRLFIGREGYEEPLNVSWDRAFARIIEGLHVSGASLRRSSVKKMELLLGYRNPLRRRLYLSNPSLAMFMLSQMDNAGGWRLCLEDNSLEELSMVAALAQCDALAYMPFGCSDSQGWMANIANTVQLLVTLKNVGWHGVAECVGMPVRAEAVPEDRELAKRQFITNSMAALTVALHQSDQFAQDWNSGFSASEAGIMAAAITANLNPDDILRETIDASEAEVQPEPERQPPQPEAPAQPSPRARRTRINRRKRG